MAIVERGEGSDAATQIMYATKKPVLTRIDIRRIRENEPGKSLEDSRAQYVSCLRYAYILKRKIPPIEVVRVPIQNGTWFLLVDGHHRLEAARRARLVHLDVIELHSTDVIYESLGEVTGKITALAAN